MDLCEALQAVNDRWAEAMAGGDAAAAAQTFSADGMVVVADTPIARGHAALEALFESWLELGLVAERYMDAAAEPLGDGGLLTCGYEADIRQADGSIVHERGRNVQVFRRDPAGGLKIYLLAIVTDSV